MAKPARDLPEYDLRIFDMDELELAKKAGIYLQSFARAQQNDWADLMQGVNPNQGYGRSDEARKAYGIAMALYDWSDTRWLNCQFPRDYASAADLREMLELSVRQLEHWLMELTRAWDACQQRDHYLETLPMVRGAVEKAQHGVKEALRQLDGSSPASANAEAFHIMAHLAHIADRFEQVLLRLKKRRKSRAALVMVDEYDVQYLFQSLLALEINDIRPEEFGGSVAGSAGRVDTYLPDYRCCVEFKMTRAGLDNATLRKQIADDFVLYGADDRYDFLFVFVHDPQKLIYNPVAFEKDMSVPRTGLKQVVVSIR